MHRRDFLTAPLLTLPLFATRVRAAPVPVVLELFTSQGCSSCPPADAFLGELVRQPGVIGLAWHVDYWNSLGWRDPYARRDWTDRQKSYAKYLDGEVYTPALVVNGATMMVGSDKAAIKRAIAAAAPPPVAVTLRRTASGLEAEIGTSSTPATGTLVSYDPEQATQVGAGENSGRQLVEYRVVRDVVTLDALPPRLVLPTIPEHRGMVLLIQDASWRILGAADLPPSQGS
jgi:hypothetical protein